MVTDSGATRIFYVQSPPTAPRRRDQQKAQTKRATGENKTAHKAKAQDKPKNSKTQAQAHGRTSQNGKLPGKRPYLAHVTTNGAIFIFSKSGP